jgi:hypothetical protein
MERTHLQDLGVDGVYIYNFFFARPSFFRFCCCTVILVYRWYEEQVASSFSGVQGLSEGI